MFQAFADDLLRLVLVVGAVGFNQCDGFGQEGPVAGEDAGDQLGGWEAGGEGSKGMSG